MSFTKKEIREKAVALEKSYNPYKARAVKYGIGSEIRYFDCGKSFTEKEITEAYIETAIKDITRGFKERMVGWYDKWYRYNHADQGRAYDEGQKRATLEPKCSEEFHIIECGY